MTEATNYRDWLAKELEKRYGRNPSYSLRAFARDVGLSAASLSLVLSGKQGLSRASAAKLAKKLGFNSEEQGYFCSMVECEHARSTKKREIAKAKLHKYTSSQTLQLDAFHAVSDWYHMAILELTTIRGFKSDLTWIANSLDIPVKAAGMAIERLKKLELLEEIDGVLRQTQGFMATPSGIPSSAIKNFHKQILNKAEDALFEQPIEERDFSALVIPMRQSDMAWAKEQMKEFRRGLMARLELAEDKDSVYCFSMQLFNLQKQKGTAQ